MGIVDKEDLLLIPFPFTPISSETQATSPFIGIHLNEPRHRPLHALDGRLTFERPKSEDFGPKKAQHLQRSGKRATFQQCPHIMCELDIKAAKPAFS